MRPCLSVSIATCLLLGPAPFARAADAPARPLVLRPVEPPALLPGLWDVIVPGAVSGALLGLARLEPVASSLAGLGAVGQIALLGGVAAGPPAVELRYRTGALPLDGYVSSLTLGLVGLGLGFAASRPFAGPTAGAGSSFAMVGLMALGQGLGNGLGYSLYTHYRNSQPDWNRLPEHRTDDPIQDWDLHKERRNRL